MADTELSIPAPPEHAPRGRKGVVFLCALVVFGGAVTAGLLLLRPPRDDPQTPAKPADTPEQAAGPAVGRLVVTSEPPGADLIVDGIHWGQTPARIDSVPVGKYGLVIERIGWMPHEEALEILKGQETTVSVTLLSERIVYYEEAIARDPDNPTNYVELGRLHIREGDTQKGADLLLKALRGFTGKGRSERRSAWRLLMSMQRVVRDLETEQKQRLANYLLSSAMQDEPDYYLARLVRDLLVDMRRWEEAADLASFCLSKDRGSPTYLTWRLHAVGKLGNWEQFERDLQSLLSGRQRGRRSSHAYRTVHEMLVDLGRWQDVLWLCDVAKDDRKPPTELHIWRLQASAELQDWQEVSDTFDAMQVKGVIDELSTDRRRNWQRSQVDQQTVLWTGALAKAELGDRKGVQALLSRYESEKAAHYWVDLVRGELWIRQRTGDPPKPWLAVTPCTEPPKIDGQKDDLAWQQAGRATEFTRVNSTKRSRTPTTILATYDREQLYLCIVCAERPMRGVELAKPSSGTGIELFIDAGRDYTTYRQFMLSSNAEPRTFDCVKDKFSTALDIDPKWSPHYEHAIRPEKAAWIFELALPFDILEENVPKAGDVWSFNLIRYGTQRFPEHVTFAPMYRSYHQPARFALLVFK